MELHISICEPIIKFENVSAAIARRQQQQQQTCMVTVGTMPL